MVKSTPRKFNKLLILSSKAGSMSPAVEGKLRRAFEDYEVAEFDPRMKLDGMLAPKSQVVVAGGDGTVGWTVKALVDTDHSLGILGLGTYNNFAGSVGMPKDLGRAIKVVKSGVPHSVTVGRINGHTFVEVAALGMFGEALQLGEAAKDMVFGKLSARFAELARSEPFEYQLSGDIEGYGVALSLVFANTPSTGARMKIAAKGSPLDPYLELQVHAGESYRDLLKRMVRSAVGAVKENKDLGMSFKFKHLRVETRPRARAFADSNPAGRSPAVIDADVGGLNLILPAGVARKQRALVGSTAK
ncbi:MAG: diacylglycerol/lipid kinase family protein [Candidatus Dormibacteria bacterium]